MYRVIFFMDFNSLDFNGVLSSVYALYTMFFRFCIRFVVLLFFTM